MDLLPAQVDYLSRSQAMPVSQEDHQGITVTVAIVLGHIDQSFHLSIGQVLPGPQIGIFQSLVGNCSIFSDWRDQPQLWFCDSPCAPLDTYCSYIVVL